jgi:hypothetical protein
MGFLKKAPDRVAVEVVQSMHGQTFIMWPPQMTTDGRTLPDLPLPHQHARSRQWLLANKTVVLILPAEDQPGGVIRHIFDVVTAKWNGRTKTLTSIVSHPDDPEFEFAISTSGVGCSCTQGPAGNAGPIDVPYKLVMVNSNTPEFDWYEVVTQ